MLDVSIEEIEKVLRLLHFRKKVSFSTNKFMFSQFVSFVTHASHEIMHIEFLKNIINIALAKD